MIYTVWLIRLPDSNFSSRTHCFFFFYYNVIQLSWVIHRVNPAAHRNKLSPALCSVIQYHPWLSAPLASSRPDLSAVILLLHVGRIDSREPAQLIQGHFHVISFSGCTRPIFANFSQQGTMGIVWVSQHVINISPWRIFDISFLWPQAVLDSIAKWLLLLLHKKRKKKSILMFKRKTHFICSLKVPGGLSSWKRELTVVTPNCSVESLSWTCSAVELASNQYNSIFLSV